MSGPIFSKYRKFITTAVGFCFLVVGVTGVIFQFWFKNNILQDIHGWLGVGMVAFALLHITQNWKALTHHMQDKRVFLLLVPVCAVAFYLTTLPRESGKINAKKIVHLLEEAKLDGVAAVFKQDPSTVISAMKEDGITAQSRETIEQIAQNNHASPDKILGYFVK